MPPLEQKLSGDLAQDVLKRFSDLGPNFAEELRRAAPFKTERQNHNDATKYGFPEVDVQTRHQLYEHSPQQDIKPENVRQGALGDCYFLSSVASLAKQNPDAIAKMIHQNNDGTYTVTFPGDPKHPVTVAEPSESQLTKYAQLGGGEWCAVLELAHRKYTQKWTGDDPGTIGNWKQENGDNPEKAIQLLTGRSTRTELTGSYGAMTLERNLSDRLKRGQLSVACTSGTVADAMPGSCNPPTKIVAGHAYTVMGVDTQHHRVILRNPWGYNADNLSDGNAYRNGEFSMSTQEFQKAFPWLCQG